jgi:hypothetical protein
MFLDGLSLRRSHRPDRYAVFERLGLGYLLLARKSQPGTDDRFLRSSERRRAMRKAMDAEQREKMLYLADLGTAVFSSALIVCVLRVVGDLM